MTTDPQRPEVDDPRVLALAKARQQLAYENPFNAVCPPWDGLSEQEQRLSLLGARSYLHAAINAGLITAVSGRAATAEAKLGRITQLVRRLAAHAVGFQDVLDDSDRGPWAKTVGADIAELTAVLGVEEPQQPTADGSGEAEPDVASGQCGHDEYHDAHEWADRPGTWCPGHSVAEERP